ncbi:MAG: helix-turn-helix domain-containing protein [Candidatus Binatia bacterium]
MERILAKNRESGIAEAYLEHGYRLQEIAAHLGVHYATVSRKLKKIERTNWPCCAARPAPDQLWSA